MVDAIFLLGAAVSALLGNAWLALAMDGHWQQVHGTSGASQVSRPVLQILGALGLLGCGALCFAADRPSMALLLWVMLLALGAATVALTLAWKPALLRMAWPARSTVAG